MMSRTHFAVTGSACALALAVSLAPLPASAAAPTTATVSAAPTTAAGPPATRSADVLERLKALDGFTVEEKKDGVPEGFRYFVMKVRQPVDHTHPEKGTFEQRVTLLHRDVSRPTVFFTSGYDVSTTPSRSEPTRIVDGNQVSMEYRFFTPSRPKDPDWRSQLTIKQAADDQHRIYAALRTIYTKKWIATGGSKGGMTATYYRYFHPKDMSGTVPYVAPNDVVNHKDVYNRFLSRVGNPTCRADLTALQRRVLGKDRAWFNQRLTQESKKKGNELTFDLIGSVDRALETAVVDSFFAFWQYQPATACGRVPDATYATREEIWAWFDVVNPLTVFSDQEVEKYVPYFYQAAAQLGWPEPYETWLKDVIKYPGLDQAPSFVPAEIRPSFDRAAMPAVDRWVKTKATRMLFVYGTLDPWSAEAFTCGSTRSAAKRQCNRYDVRGGNHGATIQQLPEPLRTRAKAQVRSWAGLDRNDPAVTGAARLSRPVAGLDRAMVTERRGGM